MHNGSNRDPDLCDTTCLLVIIKHPASHIINYEKSGSAGCT